MSSERVFREGQDWNFQARLKFSSKSDNFKRDCFFSSFGPSWKVVFDFVGNWVDLANGTKEKTAKKKNIKEFGGRNAPEASQRYIRDIPGTPGTFWPILVEILVQGAECPRDMSMGQAGHTHTPGGVPPKFFMFIGFLSPAKLTNVLRGVTHGDQDRS